MSPFKEVGLTWQGNEYVVPADKVMGLVATVEDIITIEELTGKGVKRAKVSQAFTAAIRYAAMVNGTQVKITEEDVYASLFGAEAMQNTVTAVHSLLSMMIPPEHLQSKKPDAAPRKKSQSRATGTSKQRT